jgi:hypothetical protein
VFTRIKLILSSARLVTLRAAAPRDAFIARKDPLRRDFDVSSSKPKRYPRNVFDRCHSFDKCGHLLSLASARRMGQAAVVMLTQWPVS